MRASFLDDRIFPLHVMGILIALPAFALIFGACSQPSTPEEKAERSERFAEHIKEEMVTITPRPGVECYVIRGYSSSAPRAISCITLPKESN